MSQPKTIHRHDYRSPDYRIETVHLRFELGEDSTLVQSRLELTRISPRPCPLVLDGVELELLALRLDGEPLDADRYRLDAHGLTLEDPPQHCLLEVVTRIRPQDNTSLEGLFKSSGNFCTQCEAQGFRKITYYLDRPDVMARFTTTLVADPERYPVLLSNGNLTEQGRLEDGRHFATWEDPFPKPSYLFALVAGHLQSITDTYATRSGRQVDLRIYVEPENVHQCGHAMRSLKAAMAWDEQVFGLEYDLDIYMIVAVGDFNMGAMENKGLNVFNTVYVLAKPETATDADYQNIEGVIGHEYFHNWTGNRVTCRDWFQLSLKEGLTVYRDQEFTADRLGARAVKRIQDVRILRSAQFPQDAGPMAHPVRPDEYIEINNFYTVTVYNKGAEVIRMMEVLLGREGFRRGMDLYFQRHDGQAVTCDDFASAMEDANGADLGQFRLWYSQAGTPTLEASGHYDPDSRSYTLTLRQNCPPTPGQPDKQPFHIPVRMGLLGHFGQELPLRLAGENAATGTSRVLALRQGEQNFRFEDVAEAPLPSLLRGFSAPVKLHMDYSDAELAFLLAHDSDDFNRWDAGETLAVRTLLGLVEDFRQGREPAPSGILADAYRRVLTDPDLHPAMKAQILTLPGEGYLAEQMDVVDVDGIHGARTFLRQALATALRDVLLPVYEQGRESGPYTIDALAMGRRALTNRCLDYLARLDDPATRALATEQFGIATNMTDQLGALGVLAELDIPERATALESFYQQWRHEALVVNKWFTLQATAALPDTLGTVRALLDHSAFSIKNPNKVRALIGAFCQANPVHFHAASGAGYAFLADQVLNLNPLNPQVAARLLGALSRWRKYDPERQGLMRTQLRRILEAPNLSPDVYEIAVKSLGQGGER